MTLLKIHQTAADVCFAQRWRGNNNYTKYCILS